MIGKNNLISLLFSASAIFSGCSNQPTGMMYDPVEERAGQTILINSKHSPSYDVNDNYLTPSTIEDLASTVLLAGSLTEWGSGVVLLDQQQNQYYLLTCAHVVTEVSPPLHLEDDEKVYGIGTVSKIDLDNDLALLRLSGEYTSYFKGKIADKIPIGAYGIGFGYPQDRVRTLLHGTINRASHEEGSIRTLEGSINFGESRGGFFVFQNGQPFLGGLIHGWFSDRNSIGLMVRSEKIKDFLKDTRLADDYL